MGCTAERIGPNFLVERRYSLMAGIKAIDPAEQREQRSTKLALPFEFPGRNLTESELGARWNRKRSGMDGWQPWLRIVALQAVKGDDRADSVDRKL